MNTQADRSAEVEYLQVAEKMSSAFANKDIAALRAVFHENAEVWHNFDDKNLALPEAFESVEATFSSFIDPAFKNIRRFATDKGFVQQHDLAGTHINGKSVNCPACLIVTVEAGKISRIEEYIDRAPISAMLSQVEM